MIAKRLIAKQQPKLVLVCGSLGKTLFAKISEQVLTKLDLSVAYAEVQTNLRSVVADVHGGKLRALFASMGFGRSFDLHLFEFHPDSEARRELLDSYERRYLVIPYITRDDIAAAGGLDKYLQRNCYLNKKRAKETTIIFNADITGLEEALREMGGERLHGFSLGDQDAELTAVSPEFKLPEDAAITNDHRIQGILFKAKNGGSTLPMRVLGGIGDAYICAHLAVLELLRLLELNQIDGLAILKEMRALPGRAKLIAGIKKTLLVDDSYDMEVESALSIFAAGGTVPLQKGHRRIAVVGDLLHQGEQTSEQHFSIGERLAKAGYDAVVGIGERVLETLQSAIENGMNEQAVFHFTDPHEAGKFIQHELKQGDLVVVKGAKEQKLESIVKELMAFPLQAKDDLLVR